MQRGHVPPGGAHHAGRRLRHLAVHSCARHVLRRQPQARAVRGRAANRLHLPQVPLLPPRRARSSVAGAGLCGAPRALWPPDEMGDGEAAANECSWPTGTRSTREGCRPRAAGRGAVQAGVWEGAGQPWLSGTPHAPGPPGAPPELSRAVSVPLEDRLSDGGFAWVTVPQPCGHRASGLTLPHPFLPGASRG